MCACVGMVISEFPCFGKYLFVKGLEVRQMEEKLGTVSQDGDISAGKGKGIGVHQDYLSIMERKGKKTFLPGVYFL